RCIAYILQPMLIIRRKSLFCSLGYMLVFPLRRRSEGAGPVGPSEELGSREELGLRGEMVNPMLPSGTLSGRTVAAARALLAGERRGMRGYIAFAGPAVVASIAYIDPGNFATNIQAGARYGYELLWVVLLANLIAMLFQALSAKLGIVTRRNLPPMCPPQFPPPPPTPTRTRI